MSLWHEENRLEASRKIGCVCVKAAFIAGGDQLDNIHFTGELMHEKSLSHYQGLSRVPVSVTNFASPSWLKRISGSVPYLTPVLLSNGLRQPIIKSQSSTCFGAEFILFSNHSPMKCLNRVMIIYWMQFRVGQIFVRCLFGLEVMTNKTIQIPLLRCFGCLWGDPDQYLIFSIPSSYISSLSLMFLFHFSLLLHHLPIQAF